MFLKDISNYSAGLRPGTILVKTEPILIFFRGKSPESCCFGQPVFQQQLSQDSDQAFVFAADGQGAQEFPCCFHGLREVAVCCLFLF